MSFAEFGGNNTNANANRRRTTQQQQQQQTTQQSQNQQPSSPSFSRGNSNNPNLGLDSISESLLQYQRNVDILGKIVRSIISSNVYTPNNNELCIQYDAQVDVITQLEQRVHNQLNQIVTVLQQQNSQQSSNNPQTVTIVTKLRRDFGRVQAQAKSFQESALYKIKSIRSTSTATGSTNSHQQLNNNNNAPSMSDDMIHIEQQQRVQQQIQIQEDTLAIEIMKEREEEIRNINRGMVQVNEIYKDLANIVGQQQEQIDTIENSMDDAKNNANAGLKQIEKANEKYGTNSQCTIM